MKHRITISTAGSAYSVTGACCIARTDAPMLDAAKSLRAAGAPDSDTIVVRSSDINYSPASIGALLAYRPSPQRRAIESQRLSFTPDNLR